MNDNEELIAEALLTPIQVAELLAVPISTLSRWRTERREIPWVRVGRVVRYRPQDVQEWIEEHTVTVMS